MGKTMMGEDAKQVGTAQLMDPSQLQYLQQMLGGLGAPGLAAGQGLLQGYDENLFQKGVVDPAMKQYEQGTLPSIQQRFGDANAGSSSALNQALASSAGDLSNTLAGQRLTMQQNASQNQLGVLQQLMQMLGQKSMDPIVQGPSEGLMKPLIQAGGQIGAAAIQGSSREYKENIVEYSGGLEKLDEMNAKVYDYKDGFEHPELRCGRVGFIAEEIPSEFVRTVEGQTGVDLYGLITLLVSCVKQLKGKVEQLEGAKCQ